MKAHFEELTRTRDTSAFPVFALEHDLNESELRQMKSMLHGVLSEGSLSRQHWLLWVIYATS